MLTAKQVVRDLKKRAAASGSQKALADAMGISQGYLSDILNGLRGIGPDVQRYLGIESVTLFKKTKRGSSCQ